MSPKRRDSVHAVAIVVREAEHWGREVDVGGGLLSNSAQSASFAARDNVVKNLVDFYVI